MVTIRHRSYDENRGAADPGACEAVQPPGPPGAGSAAATAGLRTAEGCLLTTFAELGVLEETVAALAAQDIHSPFAIQELAIPLALEGHDLIGQARTGTGKTLAFGVPLLQRLQVPGPGLPQALVVVPTRELAVQVAEDLDKAGKTRQIRVLTIYGGRAYEPQTDALKAGVDIVVGTPGRLLDLAKQKALDLSGVRTLVLDEADRMLDLGFLPDVERILRLVPEVRQSMLFSATMPAEIVSLSRRYLSQPTHVRAEMPDENATVPLTQQHVLRVHNLDKIEILARLLQAEGRGLAMVFCRTKRMADRAAEELTERGFAAAAVHGDLGQGARERSLRAFRNGKVDVLVATDVAARGIDVDGVTHVVNYDCPEDEKAYLHRIGRTGRAGEAGIAVTFVEWDELVRWKLINKALDLPFDEPAETYSTSDHLFEQLGIPTEVHGTLPEADRTRAGLKAEKLEDLGETGRQGGGRDRDRSRSRSGSASKSGPKSRSRSEGGRSAGDLAGEGESDKPRKPRRRRRRTRGGEPAGSGSSTAGQATAPATGEETTRPARRRRSRSTDMPESESA